MACCFFKINFNEQLAFKIDVYIEKENFGRGIIRKALFVIFMSSWHFDFNGVLCLLERWVYRKGGLWQRHNKKGFVCHIFEQLAF